MNDKLGKTRTRKKLEYQEYIESFVHEIKHQFQHYHFH